MKKLFALMLLAFIAACSHPQEIVGEGDIRSSTTMNDCLLEDQPCANYVAGDYNVTYAAQPRAGWVFTGWEGCGEQFPQCSVSVPGAIVEQYLGQTAPALRALFTPVPASPDTVISASWSAVTENLIIDVTFSNLVPTRVQLFPQGLQGEWIEVDTSAPFSFSLDVTLLEPGDHEMLIIADDGAVSVSKNETITVSGCNGHHDLCSQGYDQVRYATTHNAMSSSADGWAGPNQNLDVPAQLAAGVRGLMLDTYRAGDLNQFGQIQVPGVDPDNSYLCHSVCALGKQPLVEGLSEIRAFLDANPGAVITLIIESYLSHELTANAFDAASLTPYAYQYSGGAWPTLGQLIDAGTRLVVLQDVAVNPTYPWLLNVWDHAFETHFSASSAQDFSCDDNRGVPGSDLFIFNHFLTNVFGSPSLADQVNHNPLLQDRVNECEAFHATPANFVTVDFVDIGDTLSTIETLNELGGY